MKHLLYIFSFFVLMSSCSNEDDNNKQQPPIDYTYEFTKYQYTHSNNIVRRKSINKK